jgi:H+/Cl- antiporter ClcA
MVMKKDSIKHYAKHETKRNVLKRFLIVLSILIVYLFVSIWYYGLENGIVVSFLTWSLFVLCTPIADAGFLLDFPIRLFTKIKMIYSEVFVWIITITLNIITITIYPSIYEKTIILQIFKTILLNPLPYWGIIILSAIGTFLSIYFGDELLDVITHKQRKKYHKHKKKHWTIIILFIITITIFLYFYLINQLGIKI